MKVTDARLLSGAAQPFAAVAVEDRTASSPKRAGRFQCAGRAYGRRYVRDLRRAGHAPLPARRGRLAARMNSSLGPSGHEPAGENAYVHGDAGGEVTVTVRGSSECRNSGAGGALDADHIFERFYQGQGGSTGLGLRSSMPCAALRFADQYAYINRCHCFTVHFPK